MFSRIQDFALLVTNQTMNLRKKSTIQTNQGVRGDKLLHSYLPSPVSSWAYCNSKAWFSWHWPQSSIWRKQKALSVFMFTGPLFVTAGVEASFAWKANVSIADGRFSNSGERGRFTFPWIKLSWCHCLNGNQQIHSTHCPINFVHFFFLVDTYSTSLTSI